jgi:hypothetical protein
MSNRIQISPNNNDVVISTSNQKVVVVDQSRPSNVEVTQPIISVVEVKTGPQGPIGPPGDSIDSGLFSEISPNLWFTTSSLEITGSFKVNPSNPTSGDVFLISSGSYDVFKVKSDGGVEVKNASPSILKVSDSNNIPVLTVSQSQIIILATQSSEIIEEAPNGGIYFTSSSLFVGLD